jgi:hypothetical protein
MVRFRFSKKESRADFFDAWDFFVGHIPQKAIELFICHPEPPIRSRVNSAKDPYTTSIDRDEGILTE